MQNETQGNRNPFLLLTSSETARFGGAGLFLLRANFLQESIRSTGLYIHEHRHGTAASASSLRRLRMSLGRLNLRRRPVIRTPSMATPMRLVLHLLLLFLFAVQEVRLVCVNVESDKEAIVGRPMKLTCIYCMKREEISAETIVEWTYIGPNKTAVPIYLYDHGPQEPEDVDLQWKGRLTWNGSKDLQDLSISIQNVTLNDTGRYECKVSRFFKFDSFELSKTEIIIIDLVVKTEASQDIAAMYSEIMMYVLLVFLTFWLLVEMIYCYRKISKSDELAQDTATDYLAIPSENKENPGPAVTE